MQQPTTEQIRQKISLTPREEEILTILKDLIFHIRATDANGEVSKDFCMGCERNRTMPCVLPRIYQAIDEMENGWETVLVEKTQPPAQLNPPFGWKREIEMKRVGKETLGSITVTHSSSRTPTYTLTTAVKDLIRKQMAAGRMPVIFDINRELLPILDDLQKLGIEIIEHKAQGVFEAAESEPLQ